VFPINVPYNQNIGYLIMYEVYFESFIIKCKFPFFLPLQEFGNVFA